MLDVDLEACQIDLPRRDRQSLQRYCEELERWNYRMNLTALAGKELVRRLVVEPIWMGRRLGMAGVLADVGSGNGSPAIPLHVATGMRRTHLFESRLRRAAFLRHVAATLALSGLEVHRQRFGEEETQIEHVDWITLQGVLLGDRMLKHIRSISTPTTRIVWMTSAAKPPMPPVIRLQQPLTGTEVLVFEPDLS
jgi:16S rRNA (guanine527-N7)-methyltransferase